MIAFRIFGKRQLGQLTPFDLVVLLIISNIVQNAMIGPDNSLTGGIIGGSTVFLVDLLLAYLTFRSRLLRRLLEGAPTLLIKDGMIIEENLKKELLTKDDLFGALRKIQIDPETELETLKLIELDTGGQITVTRKTTHPLHPQPHRAAPLQ